MRKKDDGGRIFQPAVLQTKQELLAALRAGELRVSKYNTLSQNQKIFVELMAFGGYTAEQAVRVIDPSLMNPRTIANRMIANPDVRDVLEELTVARDTKFKTEAMSARDSALATLQYIMKTTGDESIKLAAAKTILERTNDYIKASNSKKDNGDAVQSISYHIQVDTVNVNTDRKEEPVVIKPEEDAIEVVPEEESDSEESDTIADPPSVNPDTGMPYMLVYEGMNNYETDKDKNSDTDE